MTIDFFKRHHDAIAAIKVGDTLTLPFDEKEPCGKGNVICHRRQDGSLNISVEQFVQVKMPSNSFVLHGGL